ncbi:MAG: hypothetical protein ACWA41_01615 [Putridiphycobacter sp.]
MKKTFLIVAALGLFVATSCKKDRTCSCTTTWSGSTSGSLTADTLLTDMTKKDAQAKCDSYDASVSFGGDTYTTECELK